MNTAKDLTKEPPRSLCERIDGYAVLARMADKGRATLSGTAGEYHFNCPLDNMLFSFKGVQAEDVKNLLASGATDEQIAAWFDENGIPKTADEIKAWSDSVEAIRPYENPEQRDRFASECARLGLLIPSKADSATILIPTIELNHTERSDLPVMQNESAYAAGGWPDLKRTELEAASIGQIRLRLFKIAARLKASVRRIHVELCSAYPLQALFGLVHQRLANLRAPA